MTAGLMVLSSLILLAFVLCLASIVCGRWENKRLKFDLEELRNRFQKLESRHNESQRQSDQAFKFLFDHAQERPRPEVRQ